PGAWGGGPAEGEGRNTMSAMGALGDRFSAGLAGAFSRQLQLDFGTNGDGPLGQSLSGWVHQASGAAAAGVASELPTVGLECDGARGQACVDRRVYDLSRVAGNGFTEGMVRAIRVPLFFVTFGAGLVVAFIIALFVRNYGRRTPAQP